MGVSTLWARLVIGFLIGLLSGCSLSRAASSPVTPVVVESEQTLTQSGLVTIERVPGEDREPASASQETADPQIPATGHPPLSSREADLTRRFPGKTVLLPGGLPPQHISQRDYVIGVEDVLKITVWQNPDLSTEVAVRPDGRIALSPVGEVEVVGLRPVELQARLTTLFERFVKNPQVTVAPAQMHSRKVFFAGRVKSPGTVLLKRHQSLLESIAEVDILDNADLSEAYVVRADLVILVDLARLLDGDLSQNLTLEPQDKVVIPAMDKEVFVLGEVARPGKLKLSRRAWLIDAISQAGGPTEKAYLLGAYLVRGTTYMPLNMAGIMRRGESNGNMPLEHGDLLVFPSSEENKVFVLGEVNTPGPVRSPKPLNIVEALGAAGGFNIFAAPQSVRIVRGNPQDPLVLRVDMSEVAQMNQANRIRLRPGDIVYVPPSWLASWNRFVSQILPGITSVLAAQALGALAP